MSYDYYLYRIDKETCKDIKHLAYPELEDRFSRDDGYFNPGYHITSDWNHNMGTIDAIEVDAFKRAGVPMFNEKTMEYLEEYEPYLVGKEGLIELINLYKGKVIAHFKRILSDFKHPYFESENKTASEQQEFYVKTMLNEWVNFPPINMDEQTDTISTSHKYEYIIFELVRVLKTTDFEKDTIMFCGH